MFFLYAFVWLPSYTARTFHLYLEYSSEHLFPKCKHGIKCDFGSILNDSI